MIEKVAIGVVCDRCGADCSEIKGEQFFFQCDLPNPRIHKVINNPYHYTTISAETFDSRYNNTNTMKLELCGKCFNEFGEWLKRSDNNAE